LLALQRGLSLLILSLKFDSHTMLLSEMDVVFRSERHPFAPVAPPELSVQARRVTLAKRADAARVAAERRARYRAAEEARRAALSAERARRWRAAEEARRAALGWLGQRLPAGIVQHVAHFAAEPERGGRVVIRRPARDSD